MISRIESKFSFYYVIIFAISAFALSIIGSYIDYHYLKAINLFSITGLCLTFISSTMGIICVVLVVKENVWNFVFAIISSSAWFIYVIFWSPLIWDALINIVYIILDIYGLYYWLHPTHYLQKSSKKIALTRSLTCLEYGFYIIFMILAIMIIGKIGAIYGRYTSNLQAYTDATTTIFAIIAKFLTAKKILQSWLLWIAVNLISIPLYISIDSYTLVAAWSLYLVNAIYGLYLWRARMLQEKII